MAAAAKAELLQSGGTAGGDAEDAPIVSFGGEASKRPVVAHSLDAHGGQGRRAWPDMRDGGSSRSEFVEHHEGRRLAESGHVHDSKGSDDAKSDASTASGSVSASRLWRIHGKLYDVDTYMDSHPGGREWLELMRGTDATQAFEAYHFDGPKVEKVLARYYVRDAHDGEFAFGDRFTYHESGFWRTLRRRCLEKLKSAEGPGCTTLQATSATRAMRLACTLVVAQCLLLQGLAIKTGSKICAMLAGICMNGMWGIGHNFMHQASKKQGLWPYLMDYFAAFHTDWRISHAISHHLDTNLDTDWEYANFFEAYENPDNTKGRLFPLVLPLYGIIAQLFSVKYFAKTLHELCTGRAHSVCKHWGHLLPACLPPLQLYAYIKGQKSFKKGAGLYMLQWFVTFFSFTPLSAGVHHAAPSADSEDMKDLQSGKDARNTFCWMEGQEGAKVDFGEHQVVATTDHSVLPLWIPAVLRDWLSLTLWAYLNNHTLHHLFPGLDHSRIYLLNDILNKTAEEFGLARKNVKPYSALAIYVGWFRYALFRKVADRR
eukprot:TRINITY_DN32755_c0_g1_i1.p1 TRINITY_DN32755_c0_g1~~TRINITY_DN32755_c0_g1_i1.p1  ORF type:complete len:543 (-),score=53.83 TRINITY_DN32755_c0_g1_i1:489-2117(-)